MGWTVFAFGGTYQWTTIPLLAGVVCLAFLERPRVARPPFQVLDLALIACLTGVAFQLVPLPPGLRQVISPAAVAFDRATRLGEPVNPLGGSARPLSLDPVSTAWALVVGTGLVALFWSARAAFARSGIRAVARGTAWVGLAVATFGIVQHATAPTLLYWYWRPASPSGRPIGPFVNRNDFACWLAMAIPVTIGYAIARVRSRRGNGRLDLPSVVDTTAVWLAGSVCLMLGALLVSLSRSGMTACAAALLALVVMSRQQLDRTGRRWLIGGLALLVATATAYTSIDALAGRVEDTVTAGLGGRHAIWRDTWVMIKDFWPTGVGAGAYVRGMLVYQTSPRRYFYFNHAHNEYLQLLAEGGLLLGVPAAVVVLSALKEIARQLREDDSAVYWIRAGAASGMIAVVVESVWDTGILMPANAVMLAILAAIALHDARANI